MIPKPFPKVLQYRGAALSLLSGIDFQIRLMITNERIALRLQQTRWLPEFRSFVLIYCFCTNDISIISDENCMSLVVAQMCTKFL